MIPIEREIEIAKQLFTDKVELNHEISERFAEDIKESVKRIIEELESSSANLEDSYEKDKHIRKLEAMLDRRKVRYKKWEDYY